MQCTNRISNTSLTTFAIPPPPPHSPLAARLVPLPSPPVGTITNDTTFAIPAAAGVVSAVIVLYIKLMLNYARRKCTSVSLVLPC